jgi:hypothetical protein
MPSLSPPPLRVCRDATFRKCRCSHFFAVPCLLFGAETVYSVVVAVMLAVIEGAARENVVRWMMHADNSNVEEEMEMRMDSGFVGAGDAIGLGKCGRTAIVEYGCHDVCEVGAVRELCDWQSLRVGKAGTPGRSRTHLAPRIALLEKDTGADM